MSDGFISAKATLTLLPTLIGWAILEWFQQSGWIAIGYDHGWDLSHFEKENAHIWKIWLLLAHSGSVPLILLEYSSLAGNQWSFQLNSERTHTLSRIDRWGHSRRVPVIWLFHKFLHVMMSCPIGEFLSQWLTCHPAWSKKSNFWGVPRFCYHPSPFSHSSELLTPENTYWTYMWVNLIRLCQSGRVPLIRFP